MVACSKKRKTLCTSPCSWTKGEKRSYCKSPVRQRKVASPCAKKDMSVCVSPCKWVSGSKRQYCRSGSNRDTARKGTPRKKKTARKGKSVNKEPVLSSLSNIFEVDDD